MAQGIVLKVTNVNKTFVLKNNNYIKAVNNVSFSLKQGQTLGVVGESGCGKTTLCRIIMGICPPDSGSIVVCGRNVYKDKNKTFTQCRDIQFIFQNPVAALNPAFTIRRNLMDYFIINKKVLPDCNLEEQLIKLLDMVSLESSCLDRYPHELSGGQCQRLCIARALSTNPKIIICDEITSALDVLTQAQIINMLLELQKQTGVAYVFVSHDMGVIRHMSDEIAIMNNGSIIEYDKAAKIYRAPKHSYTKKLLLTKFM